MFKLSKIFSSSIVASSALILSLGLLWSLHSQSGSVPDLADKQEGRPATALSKHFPFAIATQRWRFDFVPVEQALQNIKYTQAGDLILNANTAKVLEDAIAHMPKSLDKASLDRVALLVDKGFSQALAMLTINFYRYHHASQVVQTSASQAEPEHQIQDSLQRQEFYFDKSVAELLFGRQNAVTAYLAARKKINENSRLSPSEKQQRLSTLRSRFKANGQ